jgi:hypothetical protein
MEPSLLLGQVEHPPVLDNIPDSHLQLESLLNSPSPNDAAASAPAERGVCDRTAGLSPTPCQASTPEGSRQQVQTRSDVHNSGK